MKWYLKSIITTGIVFIFLILIFWVIDAVKYSQYEEVCNNIQPSPAYVLLASREERIEKEMEQTYGHNVWLNCGGDFRGEEVNKIWRKQGDMMECRMQCSAYHYTEYYYTPLYFWFEFNYTDYLKVVK